AEDTALGVDLLDGHQLDILEGRFADRHGAGQRVQDADLDGAAAGATTAAAGAILGATGEHERGESRAGREQEAGLARLLEHGTASQFGGGRVGRGRLLQRGSPVNERTDTAGESASHKMARFNAKPVPKTVPRKAYASPQYCKSFVNH